MSDFQWNSAYFKANPVKSAGVLLVLLIRYFFTIFFLYGFWHKTIKGWLWTDLMQHFFTIRLSELPAGSFQATYLEQFAIPLAMPIAWIVTIGELIIGVSLFLGLASRLNAAFGLFLLLNFAAGGFYNIWIPILSSMAILMIVLPTGNWLGLDRSLHKKYPDNLLFR